ncbi:EF-hand domain-containing family member C2 [Nephila pilipes]|uniref:EF-hand domain-containing family member C2 n=1 Tax=Nephila pilipes TaxID=299642 RepID=A0A8X6U7N1_NEPPI|nr:EF-hand domain-containing family member C2 [Nephila pilipes]
MYVGSVIYVRGKAYELLEADEYTIDYMEKHSEMFPHANVRKIMAEFKEWIPSKCGSLKFGFEKYDSEKTGFIKYENFREVLYKEMPNEVQIQYPEHAMKTLARYYADEKYIGLCFEDVVSRVQSELYRKKFYDFENLKLAFQIYDNEEVGYLDPDRIYYILRTISLPLNRDLMKGFIYKFPKNDGKINYTDLIKALNWLENPHVHDKGEPHAIQINWERNETEKNLDKIKYNCFLMDIVST